MVNLLQANDAMPAARRLRKTKVHGSLARDRRLDLLHPIDLLQLALGLRRFARLGPKPIGEKLQRRDLLLLVLIRGKLLLFPRHPLLDVAIPIPPITVQPSMRDLDDGTDELIQKFAVVRDHENRAGIIRQVFLEPNQRFEIEMVCRFVEQQAGPAPARANERDARA